MKQIQGKINFAVILLRKKEGFGLIALDDEFYSSLTNEQMDNSFILSDITEEQAAEFVEKGDIRFTMPFQKEEWFYKDYETGFVNLISSAKESLISLLKANNIWIKEWCINSNIKFTQKEAKMWETTPDDLLLIKL